MGSTANMARRPSAPLPSSEDETSGHHVLSPAENLHTTTATRTTPRRRDNGDLGPFTIERLEHDPDNPRGSGDEDFESRSQFSLTTTTATYTAAGGGGGTTTTTEPTAAASSRFTHSESGVPHGAPSGSTRDSLVSPSVRARHQPPPALPRRTDFGEYFPDGGWGWVVCGGVFVVQFLSHGFYLAGGTFMMEVLGADQFEGDVSYTVWMCSLSYGLTLTLSPLVVALCRRWSPRLFSMVGGLIIALAALFMSFSTRAHHLFVCEVLVLPVGAALSLGTSGVILGRYFRKRRECAEMLTLCGAGVGMAVFSVFEVQVFSTMAWARAMQSVLGLLVPTAVVGALYRSQTIYHPRRRVLLHLRSLAKTKKQKRDFEDRPPSFDFSPLRMRVMLVLMSATALTSAGTYVPFLLLPAAATVDEIEKPSYNLLMVYLGVAFAFGSLLFGTVVVRSGLRCMIARQYLCQIASLGCGISTLVFLLAEEFQGYALYVWTYGLFCGGYAYTIRVYTYEQVTVKLSERCMGYISFAQGISVLLGPPAALWLSVSVEVSTKRPGCIFAGVAMIAGSLALFLMPWASKHRSNHEVIQAAHLTCRGYEEDLMFAGMEVSDDCSTDNRSTRPQGNNNVYNKLYGYKASHVPSAWTYAGYKLGVVSPEDEPTPDLGALTPMSPTDKVTEFLVHSQTMLQTFSHRHNIELPNVKLEINNQYTSDPEEARSEDEIRDLTLQATVCRNSPHRRSGSSRTKGTGTARSDPDPPPYQEEGSVDVHRPHTPGLTTVSLENSRRYSRGHNSRSVLDENPRFNQEMTTTV